MQDLLNIYQAVTDPNCSSVVQQKTIGTIDKVITSNPDGAFCKVHFPEFFEKMQWPMVNVQWSITQFLE